MALHDFARILNNAAVPCTADYVEPYKGRQLSVAGIMVHHTVSRPPAVFPSLNVVKYGRSDLPGPLSQLLLGRGSAGYIAVTQGYANHAGRASADALLRWSNRQPPQRARNIEQVGNGNWEFIGIEAENTGTGEPWGTDQLRLLVEGCAALCAHFGLNPATQLWGHLEWTSTKIDPAFITPPWSMDELRAAVATELAPPAEPEPEGLSVAQLVTIGVV